MEMLQKIFADLGGDGSFLYQFAIVIITLLAFRFIFFNRLKFVLENREEKTVLQEEHAEKIFNQAKVLQRKYQDKINQAHSNAQQVMIKKKKEITISGQQEFKKSEEEIDNYLTKSRDEAEEEIGKQKTEVIKKADELAANLVEKLIQ